MLGGFFCVFALFSLLTQRGRIFEDYGITPFRLMSAYLLAGGIGGLVVGLATPLTKWLLGAGAIGFVGASILWFLVGWSANPAEPMITILKTSLILGAAVGVPLGAGMWYQVRSYRKSGKW